MADLNNLFNRLKTMNNVSQWSLDNPEAAARVVTKHPEYGNKWANVVRRTVNDLSNSGAPLDMDIPGGGTLKDMMIAAPMVAEMNDDLSSAMRAGARIDDLADGFVDTFKPRVDRLKQLYRTLT